MKYSEYTFNIIFFLEMIIKMISNGLFGWHMDDEEGSDKTDIAAIEAEKQQNLKYEAKHPKKESLQLPINQTARHSRSGSLSAEIDPVHGVELAKLHSAADTNGTITGPAAGGEGVNGDMNNTNGTSAGTTEKIVKLHPMHQQHDSYVSNMTVSTYDSTVASLSILSENDGQNDVDPNQYVGYFRDNWNILDFIIVMTSLVEFLPIGPDTNMTPIRVLRVLRPLRTFTKIPDLKVLITTIIEALKGLKNVLCLLMFLFVVFAIIGIQSFKVRLLCEHEVTCCTMFIFCLLLVT